MSKQAKKVYSHAEAIEIIQQSGSEDEGSDHEFYEHDQSSEDELFDDFLNEHAANDENDIEIDTSDLSLPVADPEDEAEKKKPTKICRRKRYLRRSTLRSVSRSPQAY